MTEAPKGRAACGAGRSSQPPSLAYRRRAAGSWAAVSAATASTLGLAYRWRVRRDACLDLAISSGRGTPSSARWVMAEWPNWGKVRPGAAAEKISAARR
jgi:hypothetical protein